MRLLVTRPRPDADKQAEKLQALGHEVFISPVMEVVFRDTGPLPLEGVQALIATSRNGLRALARNEALSRARAFPLFAVGPSTADMAQSLGFTDVHIGPGRAAGMAEMIREKFSPEAGALLHLAGQRLAADLKGDLEGLGFSVLQPRLYQTLKAPALAREVCEAIRKGGIDGVILMSPFSAKCWTELAAAADVYDQAANLRYFCLSEAVAAALAPPGARNADIAREPSEDDLLALITRQTAD